MATMNAKTMEPMQLQEIAQIAEMIRRGEPSSTIEQVWRTFLDKELAHPRMMDRLNAFSDVWSALQEDLSVVQTQMVNELQRETNRITYHNALQKQISEEIARARRTMYEYIANLEATLNSVGDDAQLANVDLQNVLQKQQQTLQMMSNISKMLHDTAMEIIRKIGG